ncbi:NusG domain II-containing protein [bacterium]|nr:NusG domain II-containing protein [bacterium]
MILILGLVSGSLLFAASESKPGDSAIVWLDDTKKLTLDLEKNGRYSIDGVLGETVIVVEEKGVRIESSPCTNHICVKMGSIHLSGQMLICVPNHVTVRVQSSSQVGVDGVTG